MRVPESMVRAVRSLQRIAKGQGTDVDLAEVNIAINLSPSNFGGIVGSEEIRAGNRQMECQIRSMPYGEKRDAKSDELEAFTELAERALKG